MGFLPISAAASIYSRTAISQVLKNRDSYYQDKNDEKPYTRLQTAVLLSGKSCTDVFIYLLCM